MTIQLKPEIERIVQQDVAAGVSGSVEEYIEQAILVHHQEQLDLAARREEISALIEEGWQSAQRGELYSEEEVRAYLEERKKEWLSKRSA
jgi:predicted transcriptional regulator